MIERRPFEALGGANHGWLDAKHHFSFAEYQDPERKHWGAIRVWNDDTIQAGTGFPLHPHSDMEIITYVREGAITHEDSLGNKGRTEAGDVQVMSAAPASVIPSTTSSRASRRSSRSGSFPTARARRRPGVPVPSPRAGARVASSRWPAASMGTVTHYRSVPTRACSAPPSRRAGRPNTSSRAQAVTATWCRPKARSRLTA